MKRRLVAAALVIAIAGMVAAMAVSAPGRRPGTGDALTAARFSLTIDGVEIASFSELSGITSEVEVVEFLEGGNGTVIRVVPGKPFPPTVTLKRGMTSSMELWAWHEAVRTGDPSARKTADLVMYDHQGSPVARYHMENAWPSKLEIGALKAGASEVLLETVTIVCENLQRVAP